MASFGSFLTFITSMAGDAASISSDGGSDDDGGDDDYAAAVAGRATVGNLGPQFNVVSYKKGVFIYILQSVLRNVRLKNLNYLPCSFGYSLGIVTVFIENLCQFSAAFLNYKRKIFF